MERRFLQGLAARPNIGPTAVALILALVALPFVALTLPVVTPSLDPGAQAPAAPPLDTARWLAALGSVVSGALVGGSIGGWLAQRNRAAGAIAAVVLAWHVGLFALPALPAAAGLPFHAASYCIDTCHIAIGGGATSSVEVYLPLGWLVAPLFGWGPLATLIVGVAIWSRALGALRGTER